MPRINIPVLQFEASQFESAITDYNQWEIERASKASKNLPYKAKKIKLISKEKCSFWDDNHQVNTYTYTLHYPAAQQLFYFAQQVGVAKAVCIYNGTYGREAPS